MSFIASPQFSCHFFPELFHSSKHICYLELAVRGAESGRSQQLGEPTFHFWWLPPWPLRSTEVVVPAPEWGAAGGGKRMFWILSVQLQGAARPQSHTWEAMLDPQWLHVSQDCLASTPPVSVPKTLSAGGGWNEEASLTKNPADKGSLQWTPGSPYALRLTWDCVLFQHLVLKSLDHWFHWRHFAHPPN